MPQYNLNGVDHIDIVEILQNSTLEQVIEIVNQNFLSLSQIADINFVDFITKKIEQRINNGSVSTHNIGKPGRNGAVILDDTIKKSVVSQGSEFISFNKFGRSVFLTIHLVDSISGTQFVVPDKFLPIVSNNVVETKLLSTEEGTLIYNSETNVISKSGNFSGDIVLTYLAKHSSTEYNNNFDFTTIQTKSDEELETNSKFVIGAINELNSIVLAIDVTKKVDKVVLSYSQNITPSNPTIGVVWYNTSTNIIKTYGTVNNQYTWINNGNPTTGTIYVFGNKNYMYNGSTLFEVKAVTNPIPSNILDWNIGNFTTLFGGKDGQFITFDNGSGLVLSNNLWYDSLQIGDDYIDWLSSDEIVIHVENGIHFFGKDTKGLTIDANNDIYLQADSGKVKLNGFGAKLELNDDLVQLESSDGILLTYYHDYGVTLVDPQSDAYMYMNNNNIDLSGGNIHIFDSYSGNIILNGDALFEGSFATIHAIDYSATIYANNGIDMYTENINGYVGMTVDSNSSQLRKDGMFFINGNSGWDDIRISSGLTSNGDIPSIAFRMPSDNYLRNAIWVDDDTYSLVFGNKSYQTRIESSGDMIIDAGNLSNDAMMVINSNYQLIASSNDFTQVWSGGISQFGADTEVQLNAADGGIISLAGNTEMLDGDLLLGNSTLQTIMKGEAINILSESGSVYAYGYGASLTLNDDIVDLQSSDGTIISYNHTNGLTFGSPVTNGQLRMTDNYVGLSDVNGDSIIHISDNYGGIFNNFITYGVDAYYTIGYSGEFEINAIDHALNMYNENYNINNGLGDAMIRLSMLDDNTLYIGEGTSGTTIGNYNSATIISGGDGYTTNYITVGDNSGNIEIVAQNEIHIGSNNSELIFLDIATDDGNPLNVNPLEGLLAYTIDGYLRKIEKSDVQAWLGI